MAKSFGSAYIVSTLTLLSIRESSKLEFGQKETNVMKQSVTSLSFLSLPYPETKRVYINVVTTLHRLSTVLSDSKA